jgi:hypothetical protein
MLVAQPARLAFELSARAGSRSRAARVFGRGDSVVAGPIFKITYGAGTKGG